MVMSSIKQLKDIKIQMLGMLESERVQIQKSRRMEVRGMLRGNEIELEDAIDLIYKGIGKLMRVRQTC